MRDSEPGAPSAKKPEPMVCPWCGIEHDFEPYRLSNGRMIWAYPPVKKLEPPVGSDEDNPVACPSCKDHARAEAERKLIFKRLRIAGVSDRCVEKALSPFVYQKKDEHDSHFEERIRNTPGSYGVAKSDAESINQCLEWVRYMRGIKDAHGWKGPTKPGFGLFIHGPVGVGKTLLIAMLCAELVRGGGWREVGAEELADARSKEWGKSYENALQEIHLSAIDGRPAAYSRERVFGVRHYSESELLRREKLSWQGDKMPIYNAMKYQGVVVLDDFHSEGANTKGAKEFAATAFERIVMMRYERRLPMIISSNANPAKLVSLGYGKRVASRINEVYQSIPLRNNGNSWRG